ncbi:hypothetical protein LTR84_004104 [Exophiala bonariae]|uniref:Uncharacterized protein n=1 Tax=Exophiala bonariae TaxID=1690606 RepID=A0AAV9N5B6_9EURO|nr:hypothetical protein LTR84_004104 [Exophiala bonariae]
MTSISLLPNTIDHQEDSPLFSDLPSEIRNTIFELALTAQHDEKRPYRADRAFYRPGYLAHTQINCSLLLTCKRAYFEARLFPLSANEHVFWLFNGPWKSIGKQSRHTANWAAWYSRLNEDQKTSIGEIHIFVQQFHLEALGNRGDIGPLDLSAKRLHLTLRHSDWWSWESPPNSSDRLGICPWRTERTSHHQTIAEPEQPDINYIRERMTPETWGGQLSQVKGLEVLEIEFETDLNKKEQLEVVVARAKHWKFPLANGTVLEWTGQQKDYSWEGLKYLKDDGQMLRESPISRHALKRKYEVTTLTWKALPATHLVM